MNLTNQDMEYLEKILQEHSEEIARDDLSGVYNEVEYGINTAKMTQLLLNCGINPINHVIRLSDYMYFDSSIESIIIPSWFEMIPEHMFFKCANLRSVKMPFVKHILEAAFKGCSQLEVIDLENIITLQDEAFKESGIIKAIIPKVQYVMQHAFFKCSNLQEVKLGEGLDSISPNAFQQCSSLQTITLPKSIRLIGENAFFDNPQLTILYEGSKSSWEDNVIVRGPRQWLLDSIKELKFLG